MADRVTKIRQIPSPGISPCSKMGSLKKVNLGHIERDIILPGLHPLPRSLPCFITLSRGLAYNKSFIIIIFFYPPIKSVLRSHSRKEPRNFG
jgi:hypothetical protein